MTGRTLTIMTTAPTLADVTAALDRRYDPGTAEDWDAVGLVCGDPRAPVRRVLFAVDPVPPVVDEALRIGADLIVTHHPLFLRPVHGVPADDPKGALVHRLIAGGCALFTAHTNADVANPGVSDALAAVLGVVSTEPIIPGRDAGTGLGRIGQLGRTVDAGGVLGPRRRGHTGDGRGYPGCRRPRDDGPYRRGVRGVRRRPHRCGGRTGADVLVTSDMRHHVAVDGSAAGRPSARRRGALGR